MKKTIRDLLTGIVNEQGKLDICQITNSIEDETNRITPIVNMKFLPKDPSTGTGILPFTLFFDEDDLTIIGIYYHCVDSSNGKGVSGVVYTPEGDELSSPDDLPDVLKSKYRPSFLSELFKNYKCIVDIAKYLDSHKHMV